MEAQILKEDNSKFPSLEEEPKSKGLEEDSSKAQEEPKSQRLNEEEHKSQRLKEEECTSPSSTEELKLNSLEEEPKSQSLEEEKEEGQDSLEHPRFNESALQFLDSMDGYLTLLDSLSWTLRQGWLQLASARHSMGGSRVSSAVLDMKPHSAATFVQVGKQSNFESGLGEIHQFTLLKWASSDNGNVSPHRDENQQLRQRKDKDGDAPVTAEDDYQDQLQKERFKSLSVFGALVSPKLRAAQLSFETALEALVEIANMRSLMLSNFHEVRKEMESANGKQ
ncbi:uncharacterized protein LOC126803358 [Argentina anserina]|uniref:uncharacterized protein LOC126803358 n=1 Tax=Argentina anserina TaxID=57926 RepID=UPI002176826F|nr:uncharacterized protein LOC126803358 [Potentilla anserina]XP_050387123.1 uncharacterized protein LOC126803358 [Potentilla anserina]